MRIAVYYNLPYGGAKRAVFEQVKGLKSLKHVVDVYTLDEQNDSFCPGQIADREFRYKFKTIKIKIPLISRIISDLQVYYKLKNLHKQIAADIDSLNYDITLVHADYHTQSPYIMIFLKTLSVYYCMEPLRMAYEYFLRISDTLRLINKIYERINRNIRRKIDRENARSASYSLAISYFCRAYMIQVYDIYPRVSYLGVDIDLFKKKNNLKKKQVLFVASKDYSTGYDLAKKAIELIPENKRPELKFVYGVELNKRITDNDVVNIYNESLVTLSLSRLDTFGLVPLESMSCGTPVIATNVAGYREIVQDFITGYLVEFEPKEIAEKIVYLIDHPEAVKKMGQAGRKYVEKHWTWDRQIKILEGYLLGFVENEKKQKKA